MGEVNTGKIPKVITRNKITLIPHVFLCIFYFISGVELFLYSLFYKEKYDPSPIIQKNEIFEVFLVT